MRLSVTAAGILLLASLPAAAQDDTQPYHASGSNPAWSLRIEGRTMRFDTAGRPSIQVARPRVIHGFAGEMYQTSRINVNVVHRQCEDPTSRSRYPDSVTVRVGGRNYEGCGGAAASQEVQTLEGSWRNSHIDGRPVSAPAEIRFADGRISGNTGCNRFSGTYRLERDRLIAGSLITTRMACPSPRMAQERRLLQILASPLARTRADNRGPMVLKAKGASLTLAPANP